MPKGIMAAAAKAVSTRAHTSHTKLGASTDSTHPTLQHKVATDTMRYLPKRSPMGP